MKHHFGSFWSNSLQILKPLPALLAFTGVTAAASLLSQPATAECLTLLSGSVVYEVSACKLIDPEKVFDPHKDRFAWTADLDNGSKKKLFDSYRGLFLKGKVIKSKATTKGLNGEEGALTGDTLFMFIPPSRLACPEVLGKRVAAALKQVCCEGGGEPPCLLDTSYVLKDPQIFAASVGDAAKNKAKHSKDYQAAEQAFRTHHWKDAVKGFEKMRMASDLDVTGLYHLGYSYRELEQCSDAVPILKRVHEQLVRKQVWADDEPDARKATLLLARCYAKMNDPGSTISILNGYLLEPAKYKEEINQALQHKDFGWIHTSQEYRTFQKEARQKLSLSGPTASGPTTPDRSP